MKAMRRAPAMKVRNSPTHRICVQSRRVRRSACVDTGGAQESREKLRADGCLAAGSMLGAAQSTSWRQPLASLIDSVHGRCYVNACAQAICEDSRQSSEERRHEAKHSCRPGCRAILHEEQEGRRQAVLVSCASRGAVHPRGDCIGKRGGARPRLRRTTQLWLRLNSFVHQVWYPARSLHTRLYTEMAHRRSWHRFPTVEVGATSRVEEEGQFAC